MAIQTFYTGPTAAELAQIPDDLKALPQWVLFQILEVPDARGELKLSKIPINPHTFGHGSTTDPDTWAAYDQCVERLPRALSYWDAQPPTTYKDTPATYCGAGLGVVLTAEDDYLLVDMDHSVDNSGTILPWARDILATLQSYSQYSVSRRGLHTLIKGRIPPGGSQHGDFQTWDHARFCAMTGWHLAETPLTIEARQSQFTMVHAAYILKPKADARAAKQQTKRDQRQIVSGLPRLSDDEILTKARAAKNSAKFNRLWAGDWSGYPSHSEGDGALCFVLAFWTRDADQLDNLFRQSGLYREGKWDARDDYREKAIADALDQVTTWYDPEAYAAERHTQQRQNGQSHPPDGTTPIQKRHIPDMTRPLAPRTLSSPLTGRQTATAPLSGRALSPVTLKGHSL